MARVKKERPVDKKVLSFFNLAFPTIIIVILSMLMPPSLYLLSAFIEIMLAIYQFIMMKQFLDNYYNLTD